MTNPSSRKAASLVPTMSLTVENPTWSLHAEELAAYGI